MTPEPVEQCEEWPNSTSIPEAPRHEEAPICFALYPSERGFPREEWDNHRGWVCTRRRGHPGPHVAGFGSGQAIARWWTCRALAVEEGL